MNKRPIRNASQRRDAEVPARVKTSRFAVGTRDLPILQRSRLADDDVAEIAHDLKNPLGVIALEAGLLGERSSQDHRSGVSRSVMRILHNVAFLDRLVQDLLDACAMSTGDFQLHRVPADLHSLIERVVERAVGTAHQRRVYIHVAQPIRMKLDAHRIERVIANLLDNALQHAPESTGVVVRLSGDDRRASVSVIDTGPGIPVVDIPHIFERYRRGRSSQGRAGSGLGLYVSKKIVEAHGGSIGVESARGAGSRFFFDLPR